MTKLLLAEDDDFSRDMLARRQRRQGYEVVVAANGREALQSARADRPDLVLLDLDMPVMDGHAVMNALRADPHTFRIPIVVLTAHASPGDVQKALEAGCDGYEAKPVSMARLVERIERVLRPPQQPAS